MGRFPAGVAGLPPPPRGAPPPRPPPLPPPPPASSSNRELIDLALDLLGIADRFRATVSSEEVARGKPAPDVYLEAARRLEIEPRDAAAIEDSHNGILAAKAAGMRVVAIPNRRFPPDAD